LRKTRRWLSLAPTQLSQTFDHESFAIEYLREAVHELARPRRLAARALLTAFHRALLVSRPSPWSRCRVGASR